MESSSPAEAVSSEETEPCREWQSKRPRLDTPQNESGANEDCDGRLEFKNFLIRKASEYEPGEPTALHLWIDAVTRPGGGSVPNAHLLTADDLKDVVAVAPEMTRTKCKVVGAPLLPFSKDKYWAPVAYGFSRRADEWVLERLLSVCAGADLLVTSDGVTPLLYAAGRDRPFEVFKLILDAAGEHAPELARNHFRYDFGKQARPLRIDWPPRDDRKLHLLVDTMVSDREREMQHPLSARDEFGRTPLHMAALIGAGVSVLEKLVTLYPDALQMESLQNSTRIPLLAAAESFPNSQNSESIRFLMNAWPEGVRYKDDEGRTLIHRPLPDDILEEALQLWPDGIKCPDLLTRNGVLQMNPQHVKFILSRLPRDTLASFVQTMPLHNCMQYGYRRDQRQIKTVAALVKVCPSALKARDDNGQTPLHLSDWSRFTRSYRDRVAAFMTQQYPAALYLPTKNLWCLSENRGIRVFQKNVRDQALLESSIVGCFLPRIGYADRPTRHLAGLLRQTLVNSHGVPLLHIVASHSAGDHEAYAQTVSYVNELDPQSIRQKVSDAVPHGGKSRLPLHVACAQPDCRADNLQLLLDLYKPALDVEDLKGFYPFMIAATNESADVECVYRLLRHWPLTFEASSSYRSRSP